MHQHEHVDGLASKQEAREQHKEVEMSLSTLDDITPLVRYNSPLGFLALLYFKLKYIYIISYFSQKHIEELFFYPHKISKSGIVYIYP